MKMTMMGGLEAGLGTMMKTTPLAAWGVEAAKTTTMKTLLEALLAVMTKKMVPALPAALLAVMTGATRTRRHFRRCPPPEDHRRVNHPHLRHSLNLNRRLRLRLRLLHRRLHRRRHHLHLHLPRLRLSLFLASDQTCSLQTGLLHGKRYHTLHCEGNSTTEWCKQLITY